MISQEPGEVEVVLGVGVGGSCCCFPENFSFRSTVCLCGWIAS